MIGNESARGTEFQAFGGSNANHVTILPLRLMVVNGLYSWIFEMDIKKFSPNNNSHVNSTLAC
jgi:hypothetical protein